MFHPLSVRRIIEETHDAKSIVLDIPAPLSSAFAYRAGQFVTMEVEIDGKPLRRCYSLASSPDCEGGEHKLTVKRVRGGRVSNWLHDKVREGDSLSVLRPEGRFVIGDGQGPLLLFAGGSGITPVVSILKTALATTARSATLLYANRDASSIIFAAELAALQKEHGDRLRVVHRLDDSNGLLDDHGVRELANETRDADCYLCGPAPFMALVERGLAAAGTPSDRIRIERFVNSLGTAPAVPAADAGQATSTPEDLEGLPDVVEVVLRGERHRVPYAPGKTLLQSARDGGLDAPFSCEAGFCGTCVAHLLEGRVVMAADDALSVGEKRRGMVLACQSRPVSSRCAIRFVDG